MTSIARAVSSTGWLAIVVAIVGVTGAGVWWYRTPSTQPAPVGLSLPPATQVSVDSPDPIADSGNPLLVGTVTRVMDGDTIEVALSSGPIRVRLDSVDAPEKNQPWGDEARAALAGKLGQQEVALDVVTQDRYERLVAVVNLNDENVNAWLVRNGHAWVYRQYAKNREFCTWEGEARSAGRGLWGLPAPQRVAPWEFRAVQRGRADGVTDYSGETVARCIAAINKRSAPSAASATSAPLTLLAAPVAGACLIKGNVSGSGRIYHAPGSEAYERTKIDESKGERWFCTEEEARAAGWRAPRT